MKKYIKLGLLVIWLGGIYFFSSQNGAESGNLSNGLLAQIAMFFNIDNISEFVNKYGPIIRKLAHLFEYFILGILVYINISTPSNKKPITLTIVLCCLYALTDELHQLFVSDRVFMFTDILIDTSGSALGSMFVHLIDKLCFQEKKH